MEKYKKHTKIPFLLLFIEFIQIQDQHGDYVKFAYKKFKKKEKSIQFFFFF